MEGGKKISRSGGRRKEGQRNHGEMSSKERRSGGRKEGTMKMVRELIKSIHVFQEILLHKCTAGTFNSKRAAIHTIQW